MTSEDTVFSIIERSGNLPVLPELLLRLLEACDDETIPLTRVSSLIDKEPSLSYKVLQLVNSAYFGLQTPCSDIYQAVVYLGADSVKNLAVTAAVHQVFAPDRFDHLVHFNIHAFWHHCLKCALVAKRIAEATGLAHPDDSYLAGLLHDLGRLVLVSTFPDAYDAILAGSSDPVEILAAERDTIGATHCAVGTWLLRGWKISTLMADAIRYHHEPPDRIKQAFPLVKVVYVANLFSREGREEAAAFTAGDLLLNLQPDELRRIDEAADRDIVQIAADLGIRVEPPDRSAPGAATASNDHDGDTARLALADKIKGISLLSGFLENLAQAGDGETMLQTLERSMNVLLGIDRVLLLLPDADGVLLRGRTSEVNSLKPLSGDIVLPVQKDSSRIVAAYLGKSPGYLSDSDDLNSLADAQILSAFACTRVALVPLVAEQNPVGVILLGLPEPLTELSKNDYRLVGTIARQVGLSLHIAEMKNRRASEIEAERLAAISMTARKFAHEVNNPLGIINNYLVALKLKLSGNDEIGRELGIIGEEIDRISAMINQMDVLGKQSEVVLAETDLNNVLADIIQLAKSSVFAGSDIRVGYTPDESLGPIETSADLIKQIIINLLKNAAEAMGGSGSVTVRTIAGVGAGNDRDGATIVVSDTGPGLPEHVKNNLFKPFVSTKTSTHAGLGLSIVNKAVTDLGGSISCNTDARTGTSFSIFLPRGRREPPSEL